MSDPALYDDDILLWSEQQAEILRRLGQSRRHLPNALDIDNVAEEIESAYGGWQENRPSPVPRILPFRRNASFTVPFKSDEMLAPRFDSPAAAARLLGPEASN